MAGTPKQVSRLWLRRYGRPQRPDGRFAPGFHLWTRRDGQSRWLYYPEIEGGDLHEYRWLSDEGRAVMRAIFLLIVVGFLIFWLT